MTDLFRSDDSAIWFSDSQVVSPANEFSMRKRPSSVRSYWRSGHRTHTDASVTELQKILCIENMGEIAISALSMEGCVDLRKYSSIGKGVRHVLLARRAGASRRTPFIEPVAGVWVTSNCWLGTGHT